MIGIAEEESLPRHQNRFLLLRRAKVMNAENARLRVIQKVIEVDSTKAIFGVGEDIEHQPLA